MSVVRPEFGPTLPELLRPFPRWVRLGLAALAGALLIALVVSRLGGGEQRTGVVVREPITFNFVYDAGVRRVEPRGEELARVEGPGRSFTVSRIELPDLRGGDIAGATPIFMEGLVQDMATTYDGFLRRQEGRTNINKQQGYELVFQFKQDGRTRYGRRVLLFPTPVSRVGADLLVLADRTPAVPRADAVGKNGPLKVALRSFRFGTERP